MELKSINEITEQILTDEEKRRVKELKEFGGLFAKNKTNKNNTGGIEMEENK